MSVRLEARGYSLEADSTLIHGISPLNRAPRIPNAAAVIRLFVTALSPCLVILQDACWTQKRSFCRRGCAHEMP